MARLTQTPITSFNSAVNSTIVTNPELFPLDQPMYVDASHDTVMTVSEYIYLPFWSRSLAHCLKSFHCYELYKPCFEWTFTN